MVALNSFIFVGRFSLLVKDRFISYRARLILVAHDTTYQATNYGVLFQQRIVLLFSIIEKL